MSLRTNNMFTLALGAALLSATAFSACDSQKNEQPDPTEEITPFSVAARVHGSSVDEVTARLASFINEKDDVSRGFPGDWIVAGAKEMDGNATGASLHLPGGGRLIEVCNHHYASQAMSFGGHHGVALPCEIAVVQQGDDVEVVLLNPEAIFSLFFADIPVEHIEGMSGLADAVRGELEDLVAEGVAGLDAVYPNEDVGPVWQPEDVEQFIGMDHSIVMDLAIPSSHLASAESRQAFKSLFVEELLETLTYEGMESVGSQVAGLSVTDWRSARPLALGLPGKVNVVEMCSPTYAKAAISTGAYHAPALPCQTAVWVDGDVLKVHLLDPLFIFPVFFSDAPAEMMESMGGMASSVRQDIQLIVAAAQDRALALAE